MFTFIRDLKIRNEQLFYFGLICLGLALIFLILTKLTTTQVHSVNAWYKPFKFAFSVFLFSWAMGWYCYYLSNFNIKPFNWAIIILNFSESFVISLFPNTSARSLRFPFVILSTFSTSFLIGRVITFVQSLDNTVFLLDIYDKSEQENISNKELPQFMLKLISYKKASENKIICKTNKLPMF